MPKPNFHFGDTPPEAKMSIIDQHNAVVPDFEAKKTALDQADMDRYVQLSKAYLGGPNIPFEIQLLAFDKHGEAPSGIEIDHDALDGLSVVDFLREIIPLRDRKDTYGVKKGVVDPEALLEVKQRAVVIYTKCALTLAEQEAISDAAKEELASMSDDDTTLRRAELEKASVIPPITMIYFPTPSGATLGKNGFIPLFPGYPDSPVGMFRGDGAGFNAMECIEFIAKHFPDVEDEIMGALADA